MGSGREDKLPWAKWFWADYESDIGLRTCGLKAQGLWMRMLSIMARSKRKGFLLDGEKQMESKTLAKITGEPEGEIEILIEELFSHGVPSKTKDGIFYNRRMAREATLSKIRAESGRKGGRPRKQSESKVKANTKQRAKAKGKGPSAYAYAYDSISSSIPSSLSSLQTEEDKTKKEMILSIVSYLNEKAGKKFSPKSKDSIEHISARLADGRTIEDFKYVIDVKVSKWKGKTWPGRKEGEICNGDDFLRPSTLFTPKNFENYLNESMPGEKEVSHKYDGIGEEC